MTGERDRAHPFGDFDLSNFRPIPPKVPLAQGNIRAASENDNFPSRAPEPAKPMQGRRRTGRNVQFNIKATAATIVRFTALANNHGVAFGELLEPLVVAAE